LKCDHIKRLITVTSDYIKRLSLYLSLYNFDVMTFPFSEAQKRVEEMERERQKLDRQLDLAQEKSKKANIGQEVLEAKMKVR
jgi:hypothetical protein